MKAVVFIAKQEFKDETLASIRSMLKKWGVDYDISSYSSSECVGYHGAVCKPDINASSIRSADYDAIILVDGPGVDKHRLFEYRPLLDIVRDFFSQKKPVLGIGNAVKIIARTNIIRDAKMAMPADKEVENMIRLYSGVITRNSVESSNGIITARGSSDSMEAAIRLLEKLGLK